jgi:hypothetical protein
MVLAGCFSLKADESEADMIRKVALLAAVSVVVAPAAFAGGDDYDAMNDTEGKGPAYFGFVRDARGSPVSEARVILRPKSGGDAVTIKSNAVGLYRSHVRKEVAPDDVEVSCEKDGYKQQRVQRRTPPGSTAAQIETNCTLQRL